MEEEGAGGGVGEGGGVRWLAELRVPELPPLSSPSLVTPSIHASVSFSFRWRVWRWGEGGGSWGAAGAEGAEAEGGEEGAEGEEGGGLGADLRSPPRKLASGGRRRTPERVEPSMAFWS